MKFEQYLQLSGGDMMKLRGQYRETAEKNVRTDLMLEAVAKAENIELSADEISKATMEYVEMYNYGSVQDFMESVNMDDFKEYVLMSKVQEFLADQAVIKTEE